MARADRLILSACLTLTGIAGCAQRPPAQSLTARVAPGSTRPSGPAFLTLDEIRPVPVFPTPRPAGASTRPSLEAIELYARARGELLDEHRLSAIPLLERAVALDPNSYELHRTLADTYRGSLGSEEHSIAELEKAAALEPDHLDLQLDLGRQYLAKGDAEKALEHLRLAAQTREYKEGGGRAPEADLFLAHALQQQGYDRAALQRYEQLLARLGKRDLSRSPNPELAFQISDKLYTQVGDLRLRQGDAPAALTAYRAALRDASHGHEAQDPGLHARIVRVLLLTGRKDEAVAAAADAIRGCRASPESVALLREACRAAGRPGGAERELARLHEEDSSNRPVLLALADVLHADGRPADADRLLARADALGPGDARFVCKRAQWLQGDGDLQGAARLLIEAMARRPDLCGQVQDVWDRLLQPANPLNRQRMTLDDLQTLRVEANAEAAKRYVVARYAARWPRRALARAALAEATAARPIFPPAFRDRLERIWADPSQTRESQVRRTEQLCDAAEKGGDPSLAAELKGRAMAARGDTAGAAAALAEAVRLAGTSATTPATPATTPGPAGAADSGTSGVDPELQLAFASSYRAFGDDAGFERLLRKLIADHPTFAAPYAQLHDYYWAKDDPTLAEGIAAAWREAEPAGLAARLYQARDNLRLNRSAAAEVILSGLLEEFPDEPEVLSSCRTLYAQSHRTDEFAGKLRAQLARQPKAFHAAEALARAEAAAGRSGEAVRVLDAARAEADDEPDVLYDLSQEYVRVGLPKTAEEVLQQVLKLDPTHPGASNDLGYTWAEQGRNLDRAEALARESVKEEPDNMALLDSLGWVLYKRGRFEEARRALERAVGTATLATLASGADPGNPAEAAGDDRIDPVVLDHLGDVMYRLNDAQTAGKLWERSRARLGELTAAPPEGGQAESPAPGRDDLGPLRLQLQQKQKQLKAGRPVSVAPVAEAPLATPPTSSPTSPATRAARSAQAEGR